MLNITQFEYVLNIANVVILVAASLLCYSIIRDAKDKLEKSVYNLIFMVATLLLVGQLLNVLLRFNIMEVPGGSALAYLVLSSVLLYRMLMRQKIWKID